MLEICLCVCVGVLEGWWCSGGVVVVYACGWWCVCVCVCVCEVGEEGEEGEEGEITVLDMK